MSVEYRIGDVTGRLREIPDGSIDLVVTSPPFLALRSYLPSDHPDKAKEIGSEPTPAAFIDTLLALSAEFSRVLAPHGSICIELGDTYSGSGGAGGDYAKGGLRDGQEAFDGSARRRRDDKHSRGGDDERMRRRAAGKRSTTPAGWPLAKSLTGIPTLYTWSLAYGRNLLTGADSPAGEWRIRNLICWARPNPPVGALGDKFRPATSYITVACKGPKRYFDLDAVRAPGSPNTHARTAAGVDRRTTTGKAANDAARSGNWSTLDTLHRTIGAPPLDWHADDHPEDGDWLWKLPTQPYPGSHYATYPLTLPKRLIEAMCPQRVCLVCGTPSTRIVEPITPPTGTGFTRTRSSTRSRPSTATAEQKAGGNLTVGWTQHQDCHDPDWTDAEKWRTGVVLDPFAGSGTTLEAAQAVGRHAIGIDIDARNADLALQRVGMFLSIDAGPAA